MEVFVSRSGETLTDRDCLILPPGGTLFVILDRMGSPLGPVLFLFFPLLRFWAALVPIVKVSSPRTVPSLAFSQAAANLGGRRTSHI